MQSTVATATATVTATVTVTATAATTAAATVSTWFGHMSSTCLLYNHMKIMLRLASDFNRNNNSQNQVDGVAPEV